MKYAFGFSPTHYFKRQCNDLSTVTDQCVKIPGNLSNNITQYKDPIISKIKYLEDLTKDKVSKFKLPCRIDYRQDEKSAGVSVAYEGFGKFGKVLATIKDSHFTIK